MGLGYSVRAGQANAIYYQVKFKGSPAEFEQFADKARLAQDLYPYNYRLCGWIAQQAWTRYATATSGRKQALRDVKEWSDAAVDLNPYPRSIREVRRKQLEETDMSAAIAYWAEFVEWNFWDPYNHSVLLELYTRAGNLEGALSELRSVRGTAYAARAIELIRPLVDREFTAPSSAR